MILFHFTDPTRLDSIASDGLKPMPSLDGMCDRDCVWFTKAKEAPWLEWGTVRLTVRVRRNQAENYQKRFGDRGLLVLPGWQKYFPEWWVSFDVIPLRQIIAGLR